MDIKTILWPVDLSENSLKVEDHVHSLAMQFGARVVLLYVALDLRNYFPAYGNYPSPELYERFEAWERAEAAKRLDTLCHGKLARCAGVTSRIVTGDPATEILKAIDTEGAGMVVMSIHGYGQRRARELDMANLPGDVAAKVSRMSPVPVQLVAARTA